MNVCLKSGATLSPEKGGSILDCNGCLTQALNFSEAIQGISHTQGAENNL